MANNAIVRAGVYGVCGLAAYSIDQAMNYEFMVGLEGGMTSLVIAVPVAGLLCAAAWASTSRCVVKGGLPNAIMLIAVFVLLAAFSLGASVYRAGEAYDAKLTATKSQNMPILIARKAMDEAKADWAAKDKAVEAELANGGCGPICRDKKAVAAEARARYELAKARAAELGAPKTADPMAHRLASIFSIPESWVQMAFPLSLPIGIWLASVVFIGLAVNELGTSAPALKKEPNKADRKELPLCLRIQDWLDTQERLDGQRPTQKEAALHFRVSPSTVSRHLAKVPEYA